MTDKNEVLELAKKCGIRFVPHGLTGNPTYAAVVTENEFLAFAAAMEEKHQAMIAMLVESLKVASDVLISDHTHCTHEDDAFHYDCPVCSACREVNASISATQQDAAAFVAEVEARVLTDVVTAYILQPVGLDRMSLQEIVETKVAELRNSAAQPEGKEPK